MTRHRIELYYLVSVIAAWCFTPFVRRIVDWRSGVFHAVEIFSLIPYVMLVPIAVLCLRSDRLSRLGAPVKFFAIVWTGAFSYGLVIGVVNDNAASALYAFAQFVAPMFIGIWIATADNRHALAVKRMLRVLLACGAAVAIYGIFQFISPPPWDVLWVDGSGTNLEGMAVPFGLRIFATLNSPGPCADFFASLIILALIWCRLRALWVWPLVAVLGAGLMLTLARVAWIELLVGVAVYLALSPRRLLSLPFLGIYAALLAFLVVALPSLLGSGGNGTLISDRLSTLTDVEHDDSAIAREGEIESAFDQSVANPVGEGLGQLGAAAKLSGHAETTGGSNLDSGYLSRLLELGWFGFVGYLVVTVGGPLTMATLGMRDARGGGAEAMAIVAAAAAVCLSLAWADAAGDAHFGLDGMLFWVAFGSGFALRRSESRIAAPVSFARGFVGLRP